MIIESIQADQDLQWFKSNGYLDDMNADECREFIASINKGLVQDGICLFEKGETDNGLFIIQHGEVAIGHSRQDFALVDQGVYGTMDCTCHDFNDSDWVDQAILKEGDCVGEFEAMRGQPHQLTARSIGQVEVFHIETRHLHELTQHNHKLCTCLAKAIDRAQNKLAHH